MKQIKTYPINNSPLYRLSNKSKLAELLGVSKKYLEHFNYSRDNYKCWKQKKKNKKGARPVEDPTLILKKAQSKLNKSQLIILCLAKSIPVILIMLNII